MLAVALSVFCVVWLTAKSLSRTAVTVSTPTSDNLARVFSSATYAGIGDGGVTVLTDHETGQDYIVVRDAAGAIAITPRLPAATQSSN